MNETFDEHEIDDEDDDLESMRLDPEGLMRDLIHRVEQVNPERAQEILEANEPLRRIVATREPTPEPVKKRSWRDILFTLRGKGRRAGARQGERLH